MPRATGASTRAIVTEYSMPRPEIQPHDVVMDKDGMIWYSDFSHQFIGEMDPATGKVTDIEIPTFSLDAPGSARQLN